MTLAEDPRWIRFNDQGYRCPCCAKPTGGLFDIVMDHPDPWNHGTLNASPDDILQVGNDRLSSDLCENNGDFYVRGTLPLPIIGADEMFSFGVRASLKKENFEHYIKRWDTAGYSGFPGCFGWLMNTLPIWKSDNPLPCDVKMGGVGQRPILVVHDGAHALTEAQAPGITFDQLLDVYAASGQDIRPHISDD